MAIGGLIVPRFGFGIHNAGLPHAPPQESGVSISVEFQGEGGPPPPPTGFRGPFETPELGDLVLRGFGPPGSFLTVRKNNAVSATAKITKNGIFEVIFSSISANTYELGFFAEDPEGNISQTVTFSSIPVFKNSTTTIENIFIPPTLVLDTHEVGAGEDVRLHGYTVPESAITVFFPPSELIKRVVSGSDGFWKLAVPAEELSRGTFEVRVQSQLSSGLFSNLSQVIDLIVKTGLVAQPLPLGPRPDLNDDERVDLIDLSILLYNWGEPKNARADLNGDRVVDLVDFSIMLFFWEG